MDTNTFFKQNTFFLERKIRRGWQRLGKPEGWRRFVGGISKLAASIKDSKNMKIIL